MQRLPAIKQLRSVHRAVAAATSLCAFSGINFLGTFLIFTSKKSLCSVANNILMRPLLIVAAALASCALLSSALGEITSEAPAVVTLYTGFLDPLPPQSKGFSMKLFKLRTMHALVNKSKTLNSAILRVLHVELPEYDDLMKRLAFVELLAHHHPPHVCSGFRLPNLN
jgi:hypothetical protein